MYQVKLQEFEGPLDLLLFFIKRDELDIYNIPISRLTEQFIEYLHLMKELDLAVAAEFIWMASLLMSIKVKMMLPQQVEEAEEGVNEHDPRFELVQALLEYKKYKEAAVSLREMDHLARKTYFRGSIEADKTTLVNDGEMLKNVTLIDLMTAIQGVLKRLDAPVIMHTVQQVKTSIEAQSAFLLSRLKDAGKLSFIALCLELESREYVVVTFLAALELIRQQLIVLHADDSVTDFYIEAA